MPGQAGKGNPAHARMSNPSSKETRARSATRGAARKDERRKLQDEAHQRNLKAGITPWALAKAERYKRRAPKREAWLKRQSDQLAG